MKRSVQATLGQSAKRARDAPAPALPPGASLLHAFVDRAEEERLIRSIDSAAWNTALKRRTQHYGVEYDYKKKWIAGDRQSAPAATAPLPEWCADLVARLTERGIIHSPPEQLIVNEYEPGQGIARHTDSPAFDDVILSLSLGSPCVMQLRKGEECISVRLPRTSLLELSGEARWLWTHEIPARKSDVCDGVKVRSVI